MSGSNRVDDGEPDDGTRGVETDDGDIGTADEDGGVETDADDGTTEANDVDRNADAIADDRNADAIVDDRNADATAERTAVRVRGIYATALTRLLREAGFAVVQPSAPIRERFDDALPVRPADASLETARDRSGVGVSGDPDAVDAVANRLEDVAVDAFRWNVEAPRGAVFDARVVETRGGGAVVDLGSDRRGYLPFDAVDGYVDEGQRYRVQVRDPAPPWDDDHPLVAPSLEVRSGLVTLSRGRSGVTAAPDGDRGAELVGMTDLLSSAAPEGWGIRWRHAAAEADLDTMGVALDRVGERARALEESLSDARGPDGVSDEGGPDDDPGRLAAPASTAWIWFGRESRFALDGHRRAVETTMPGHHRIKAAHENASAAVDFAEAVCGDTGASGGDADPTDDGSDAADEDDPAGAFPFGAVSRQFGPREGDRLEIGHGKPDGRRLSLGYGDVTDCDPDGSLTLERSMRGGGVYDALEVPKEDGDVAVTSFEEGRWWYPTTYRSADGDLKGTYVNVCTPVELFPDCARYVDLYVDVIRLPDGTVELVDGDELEAAVSDGLVSVDLAEKARSVAASIERALST